VDRLSSSIGNGREPGGTLLGEVTPPASERRTRARRPSHPESFAIAFEEHAASKPTSRPALPAARGSRDASKSSAVAVVLAGAAAAPLVAPAPKPTSTKTLTLTSTKTLRPATQTATATATNNLGNHAPDLADGTHDGSDAAAAPAPDAAAAPAAAADAAAPAAVGDETTQPQTMPPSAEGNLRTTRDTLPEASPPARAVSAADLEHILIADLPRAERDTSPAPFDDSNHGASASATASASPSATASAAAVLAAHASAASSAHGHAAAQTNAANPTIPPPLASEILPDPEAALAERPRGTVRADGADLRLGGDGDDSISLRITAEKHVVHVHATSADAGLADALRASADELRRALSAHGLELGELSATTSGGNLSSNGGGGNGRDVPADAEGGDSASSATATKDAKPNRRRGWVA
jgi:hypothetical protein